MMDECVIVKEGIQIGSFQSRFEALEALEYTDGVILSKKRWEEMKKNGSRTNK